MKNSLRRILGCGITALLLGLSGCATTPKTESEEEKVSTLPWNTPQKWERSAPLGGAGY